jgi:inner membrane protease subunit SOM1
LRRVSEARLLLSDQFYCLLEDHAMLSRSRKAVVRQFPILLRHAVLGTLRKSFKRTSSSFDSSISNNNLFPKSSALISPHSVQYLTSDSIRTIDLVCLVYILRAVVLDQDEVEHRHSIRFANWQQMAPTVETFQPWELERRINLTADGKQSKRPVKLKDCPLKELIQYDCDLVGPRENPRSKVVCEPVVRLFRQYVHTFK